jgi:Protein of unknown function (DUF4038)/Putative collagen-binding domain of a collagenase
MRTARLTLFLALVVLPVLSSGQTNCAQATGDAGFSALRISPDAHFIVHEDGKPFFFLGDTAWELFQRLSREEAVRYLENRRCKGFNVIQAVVLPEYDVSKPNVYGDLPLIDLDPLRPNEAWFKHIDFVVREARKRGLYIGLLPTWGDKVNKMWGIGPVIFNKDNARQYGKWIAERYGKEPNIIWILGGDRPADQGTAEVWRAMAAGIQEGDVGHHLITYHPSGETSVTKWFTDDTWLSFYAIQSGHSRHDISNYIWIANDYARKPVKPVIDAEPRYEDHPVNWDAKLGYFDDFDVRQGAYWSVFAGAAGHTYGCHPMWQFYSKKYEPIAFARHTWEEDLDLPGAAQMQYMRNLVLSRPYTSRIPDQSILVSDLPGAKHMQSTRDADGRYAFVYTPAGDAFDIRTEWTRAKEFTAFWYNPRTGRSARIGSLKTRPTLHFVPPTRGRGEDWVLVLDDAAQKFPVPGLLEARQAKK